MVKSLMLDADARERYLRHILLKEVGAQGQQKLLAARILIVGAGGLGSPILQYLAAAGVGTIGVIDDDRIALSNLQRQTIYRDEDVDELKVACAAAFARALNPEIRVIAIKGKIDAANAAARIADYDVIVEGVDNFAARFALNAACIAARKPLVSAAIGRFEGQLSVFKPWAGPALPCYRCLVPEAPPRDDQVNCAEEGVLGPLAGVVGSMAALETLKEILSIGDGLAGRLLVYDGLSASARNVTLPRDPACPDCGSIERA
ncbi:MAG TPA: molybdopterin-synthase adenylyltransferase MoeB [Parvularculaceae bacterium]|nr:molybdopterin-synthase adenylyltransferase MoeB [Parvularculaceae bacterium]